MGGINNDRSATPNASSTYGRGIGRMEALRRLERLRKGELGQWLRERSVGVKLEESRTEEGVDQEVYHRESTRTFFFNFFIKKSHYSYASL